MRIHVLVAATLSTAIASLVAGCGDDDGGDDDDGDSAVDAAPIGGDLEGLGALCGPNEEVCPEETPRCVLIEEEASLTGFCSALCVIEGNFQTNAQSQIEQIDPALTTGDASCTAVYTGVFNARCGAVLDIVPALPLQPSTLYTFNAGCVLDCGPGGLCPGDLTCDATRGYCVAP